MEILTAPVPAWLFLLALLGLWRSVDLARKRTDEIAQHLHVDDVPEYFAEQASRMEDLRIRGNEIADVLHIDNDR